MRKLYLACGLTAWTALTAVCPHRTGAEDRYFVENGVTYRESRQIVRQPVSETRMEERRQTVYTDRYTTEMQEYQRTVYMPVVEYQWEQRLHNAWNPFVRPHFAWHQVPRYTWKPVTETVRTPVTRRELEPQERVVQTPVTTLRFEDREVMSRVAVSGPPATLSLAPGGAATIARRPVIGGISQMQSDPPRQATAPTSVLKR